MFVVMCAMSEFAKDKDVSNLELNLLVHLSELGIDKEILDQYTAKLGEAITNCVDKNEGYSLDDRVKESIASYSRHQATFVRTESVAGRMISHERLMRILKANATKYFGAKF